MAYIQYMQNVVNQSTAIDALGIEEFPLFPNGFNPIVGNVLHITLRGVVGFSNVLRRMMLTVDSELIRSQITENHFLSKWATMVVPSDNRIKMQINVETISLVKKILNNESVSIVEAESANTLFEHELNKTIQKYEYDRAIALLSAVRLLIPSEVKSKAEPQSSPVNQYGLKVNSILVPFMKSHGLIITPVV